MMEKSRNFLLFVGLVMAAALFAGDVLAGGITDLKVTTRGSRVILEFDTGSAREDETTLLVNIRSADAVVEIGEGAVEGSDYGVVSLGPRKKMIWNIQNSLDDFDETTGNHEILAIKSARRFGYQYFTPIFGGF